MALLWADLALSRLTACRWAHEVPLGFSLGPLGQVLFQGEQSASAPEATPPWSPAHLLGPGDTHSHSCHPQPFPRGARRMHVHTQTPHTHITLTLSLPPEAQWPPVVLGIES